MVGLAWHVNILVCVHNKRDFKNKPLAIINYFMHQITFQHLPVLYLVEKIIGFSTALVEVGGRSKQTWAGQKKVCYMPICFGWKAVYIHVRSGSVLCAWQNRGEIGESAGLCPLYPRRPFFGYEHIACTQRCCLAIYINPKYTGMLVMLYSRDFSIYA